MDEAGFDLFAPLVELVGFLAETFVLDDQSRSGWGRHGKPGHGKRNAEPRPLPSPPRRGRGKPAAYGAELCKWGDGRWGGTEVVGGNGVRLGWTWLCNTREKLGFRIIGPPGGGIDLQFGIWDSEFGLGNTSMPSIRCWDPSHVLCIASFAKLCRDVKIRPDTGFRTAIAVKMVPVSLRRWYAAARDMSGSMNRTPWPCCIWKEKVAPILVAA